MVVPLAVSMAGDSADLTVVLMAALWAVARVVVWVDLLVAY